MSRRSVALPAALLAGLLALSACDKKNKPTADNTPMPPGGIPMPTPGGPAMPGAPGDPNAGQPNDGSLPPKPQPLGLTSDVRTRLASQNNLKQIAIGFHNAAATYNALPIGVADKSGKVGLSWRVAILPFIEHENLYKQFKLDEPWDSEHNKKLIPQMPKTYAPPSGETRGYTYYRSFSGPDAIMPPANPGRPGQVVTGVGLFTIPDGTSNTLLVAEAAEPVIWTKPDELPYEKGKPLPKLGGGVFKDVFGVAMCDGSARFIKVTIPATTLKALITPSGGEVFALDD